MPYFKSMKDGERTTGAQTEGVPTSSTSSADVASVTGSLIVPAAASGQPAPTTTFTESRRANQAAVDGNSMLPCVSLDFSSVSDDPHHAALPGLASCLSISHSAVVGRNLRTNSAELPLLARLKDELLHTVFENLAEDKPSLLSMCLVSKRFRNIAQPFLFKNVDLINRGQFHRSSIQETIQNIVARPELHRRVLALRVQTWHAAPDYNPLSSSGDAESETAHSSDAMVQSRPARDVVDGYIRSLFHVEVISKQLRTRFHRALVAGNREAEVALLLVHLPCLRHLHLDGPSPWKGSLIRAVLGEFLARRQFFVRLRSVWLESNQGRTDMEKAKALFFLPGLKELRLANIHEESFPRLLRDSPRATTIVSLEISGTHVELNGLVAMMEACKDLQFFRSHVISGDTWGEWDKDWIKGVGNALLLHRNSLQSIDVNIYLDAFRQDAVAPNLGRLLWPKAFKKLRVLKVPAFCFVDRRRPTDRPSLAEGLPKHVEHLTLYWATEYVLSLWVALLQRGWFGRYHPGLHTLRVPEVLGGGLPGHGGWAAATLEWLNTLFFVGGVPVDFVGGIGHPRSV